MLADLIHSNSDESAKGDCKERNRSEAVQLLEGRVNVIAYIADQKSEADEHKGDVGAKHLERGLAKSEKRFDCEPTQVTTQRIENDKESHQVDGAKRTDLPFIELKAECRLSEMRAQPAVPHTDEKEACGARECHHPTRNAIKHRLPKGGSRPEPEAQDPNSLPGEEVECARLLNRNLKMREMDDPVVDHIAQAELRKQPDGAAGEKDFLPT